MVINVLLNQIFIMGLFSILGIILFRTKKINENGSRQFGSLLVNLVIPVVIIKALWVQYSDERALIILQSFGLAFLLMVASIVVSRLFFKNQPLSQFAAAYCNAGFIGIPLVKNVLGDEAVLYIASTIAILNIFQWTIGKAMVTDDHSSINIKQLFKNPIILAFIFGISLFFLRIPSTYLVNEVLTLTSQLNTPLAMIITGVYLAQIEFKTLFNSRELVRVALFRLVMIPLLSIGISVLFKSIIDSPIIYAILLALSTPTGANIAILAEQNDLDYRYAVKTVCLTTLFSVLTLPAMTLLIERIM